MNTLAHVTFAVCFPDMGKMGLFLLALSFVIWCFVIMIAGILLNVVRFFLGPLKFIENLVVLGLIFFTLAIAMPQTDGDSAFQKLKNRQFPNLATIRRGMTKFGVPSGAEEIAEMKRTAAQAVEKVEEKIKDATAEQKPAKQKAKSKHGEATRKKEKK